MLFPQIQNFLQYPVRDIGYRISNVPDVFGFFFVIHITNDDIFIFIKYQLGCNGCINPSQG